MSIFVLQRYVCYEYWAMCYEVFLMCYNRNPKTFNDKHYIMNDRRRSLHPKQLEELTMLKYNKKYF